MLRLIVFCFFFNSLVVVSKLRVIVFQRPVNRAVYTRLSFLHYINLYRWSSIVGADDDNDGDDDDDDL